MSEANQKPDADSVYSYWEEMNNLKALRQECFQLLFTLTKGVEESEVCPRKHDEETNGGVEAQWRAKRALSGDRLLVGGHVRALVRALEKTQN